MLRSKEIFMAHREAASFCTKCKINWAALESQDDEVNDESYDYCPKCKNDMWLERPQTGESFMMTLEGKIVNVATQKELIETKPLQNIKPSLPFDFDAWAKQKAELELAQDARLDQYIKDCETIGNDAAKEKYLNNA